MKQIPPSQSSELLPRSKFPHDVTPYTPPKRDMLVIITGFLEVPDHKQQGDLPNSVPFSIQIFNFGANIGQRGDFQSRDIGEAKVSDVKFVEGATLTLTVKRPGDERDIVFNFAKDRQKGTWEGTYTIGTLTLRARCTCKETQPSFALFE